MQSTSESTASSAFHSEPRAAEHPSAGERPHDAGATAGAPIVVPLQRGRSVEVSPGGDSARLRVRDEAGSLLEIQIRFDSAGPLVSVRAQRLELEAAEHLSARCDTFSVHATQRIELCSGGELLQKAEADATLEARNVQVQAEPGAVRIQANDDVQLLGENVLLNCARHQPLPEWARARVRPEPAPLAPESEAGAPELIHLLGD